MSRTPGEPGPSPAWTGANTDEVLSEFGFAEEEIEALREKSVIA
jgi:crotonobetainyl-CoA:carnitine CoA-transferase CaiB-like acyl-CoA transferase